MDLPLGAEVVEPQLDFRAEVEKRSGQPVSRCYQCKKCSGGCPMAFAMDVLPNQVVRFIQLGLQEKLLHSRTIWVCSSCKTCVSRCPNDIDISCLNDVLKRMAAEAGLVARDNKVAVFHEAFLGSVGKHGRVHELGMMAGFKLKTGTYTQDMDLGINMFRRGILKVFPEKIRQKREISQIFQMAKETGK